MRQRILQTRKEAEREIHSFIKVYLSSGWATPGPAAFLNAHIPHYIISFICHSHKSIPLPLPPNKLKVSPRLGPCYINLINIDK
jgi:hypothetical protein